MNTSPAKWILTSACAALIAATAQAAPHPPYGSRHPDPRGNNHTTCHSRPSREYHGHHRRPTQVAYWGYAPPPPPVCYLPPPPAYYPPPPAAYYPPPPFCHRPPPPPIPVRYPPPPGFSIVFSF